MTGLWLGNTEYIVQYILVCHNVTSDISDNFFLWLVEWEILVLLNTHWSSCCNNTLDIMKVRRQYQYMYMTNAAMQIPLQSRVSNK